jgi:hypothetical protein
MTDIPRLAWPLTVSANGQFSAVEQDGDQDIQQCIAAIVRHRVGDRVDLPEMGIDDLTHAEQPVDLDSIVEVINRHEPRAATVASGAPDLVESIVAEALQVDIAWTPRQSSQEA